MVSLHVVKVVREKPWRALGSGKTGCLARLGKGTIPQTVGALHISLMPCSMFGDDDDCASITSHRETNKRSFFHFLAQTKQRLIIPKS